MPEAENPRGLTSRTLSRLGRDSLSINDAASTVGMPQLFVAAPNPTGSPRKSPMTTGFRAGPFAK